jgi:hypothetical protein
VNFTQYLVTVATFCMFGKDELMRFIFGFAIGKHATCDAARFDAFCDAILEYEDSKFPQAKRRKTFAIFATPQGDMFWEQFHKMIVSTPLLLWPIQRLQVKLASTNLGEPFWMSQKQAMVNARERLGIKRNLD